MQIPATISGILFISVILLSEGKLDCFGVAFSVVAGCQILGFSDVHLGQSNSSLILYPHKLPTSYYTYISYEVLL